MTGLLQVLTWIAFAAACVVAPRLGTALQTELRARFGSSWRSSRWERVGARLVNAAPMLTWMGVATLLTWPLLVSPPMSRDHAVHYYFTRLWLDDVAATGEVSGWSERFNAGIPIGESYGWLSYAWSSAFHVLSAGVVPLRTSYGWSILALWWSSAAVVAAWSSAMAREVLERTVEASRAPRCAAWAGSFAAIAWLVDPGAARQGGWNYVMFHGVWPQQLSTTLTLLAVLWAWGLLERPRGERIAAAALAVAASLVAHPFALVVLATFAVLVPVVRAFEGPEWPRGAAAAWAATFGLGALAASGFLAAFFASAGSMGRSPVPWLPLGELAAGLLRGDLFTNPAAFVGPLAVLGLGLALWRGGSRARVTVVATLGFVLLASEASVTVLGLDLFVPGLKNLQFPRFAFVLKPLLAALAGLAATSIWVGLRHVLGAVEGHAVASGSGEAALGPRADLARFVLALALAPFATTLLQAPGHLLRRPVGYVPTVHASGLAEEERALHDTLLRERNARILAGEGPLRVAFLREGGRGGTYPLFALADVGAAVVLDGHVPSVNFEPTLATHAPHVLRALGVTHVVHDGRLAAREPGHARELEPVGTHGPYTVARLLPGRVAALPSAARVLEASPGRRVLEVSAAGGSVLVPPHRRWRAVDEAGATVELSRQRVWSKGFSVVRVPKTEATTEATTEARTEGEATPRRVTLALERTASERVLGWVSLGVTTILLAWLAALAWQRRGRVAEARDVAPATSVLAGPSPSSQGSKLAVQRLAGAGVIAYGAAMLTMGDARLMRTWESAFERAATRASSAPATPVRDLVVDGAYQFRWRGLRVCDGLMDRDARAGCDPAREGPTVRTAYRAPYLHRCVEVPVSPGGRAELVFDGLRDDETVVLFMRRDGEDRRGLAWTAKGMASEDKGEHGDLASDSLRGHAELVVTPSQHRGALTLGFDNRSSAVERPCVAAAAGRVLGE